MSNWLDHTWIKEFKALNIFLGLRSSTCKELALRPLRQDWLLCQLWQVCILHLGLLWGNKISSWQISRFHQMSCYRSVLFNTNSIFIHLTLSGSILVSNSSFLPSIENMISFNIGIDLCTCFNNDRNEIIFIHKNVFNFKWHFQLSLKHWTTM